MVLSRSLPPHFLLPAWGTRQRFLALQRAHSTVPDPNHSSYTKQQQLDSNRDNKTYAGPYPASYSLQNFSNNGGSVKKRILRTKPTSSLIEGRELRNLRDAKRIRDLRGTLKEGSRDEVPIRISRPGAQTVPPNFFNEKSNIKFHETEKGTTGSSKLAVVESSSNILGVAENIPDISFIASSKERALSDLLGEREPLQNSAPSARLERAEPTLFNHHGGGEAKDGVPLRNTKYMSPVSNAKRKCKSVAERATSLFEELFPEERKAAKESEKTDTDVLPAFAWHEGPIVDIKETVDTMPPISTNSNTTALHTAATVKRAARSELGLLVLSCASKTLEESDFFRLGSKGEHIEGWTSGIIKVIQGRDNITLEPLGHYFLIFSSEGAAAAYLDHTIRLHRLSKTHGSGLSPLPFPSKYLRSGEDIKQVLRGYSLVPGQSKLSLRLINRPFTPKVAQILNNDGPAAIARKQAKSENLVLFSVDWGRISHSDLRHALSNDGKARNLHWSLIDGEGAIMKINEVERKEDDHLAEALSLNRRTRNVRSPSRYILAFKDPHEARRFIREWHRRPFPTQKEQKVGDEPAPIMNAELFW